MFGIVVSARVRKIIGTISGFMDVKSIKGRDVFGRIEREMKKFRVDYGPVIGCVVEFDDTGYFRICFVPVNQCNGIWRCVHDIAADGVWIG